MQLRQRGVHALLPVPGIQRLDAGLQRVKVHAVFMRFIGIAHRARLRHAFAHRLENRVAGFEHRLLRHIADAQPLRHLQQPVVELFEARNHLQQRGLARAIAANQAQALTGVE